MAGPDPNTARLVQPKTGPDPSTARVVEQTQGGFIEGLGNAAQSLFQEFDAARKGTSPVVRNLKGEFIRPPAAQDEQNFFKEFGRVRLADSQVALHDPVTNQMIVFDRTPESEEGRVTRAGRVLGMGMLAGSPIRQMGSVTQGARNVRPTARALQEAADVGVDLSVASASQSPTAKIVENTLKEIPVAAGIQRKAAERSVRQSAEATRRIASRFGQATEITEGGDALRKGAEGFKTRFLSKADDLFNNKLGGFFKGDEQVNMSNALGALTGAEKRFDTAELAKEFVDPKLLRWGEIIQKNGGVLPWKDVRAFRSEVGKLLTKPAILNDIDRAQLEGLYAALSKDLEAAAALKSPQALEAFKRANKFYRGGVDRIQNALGRILKSDTSDEAAFEVINALSRRGPRANVSKLSAIRRSLKPDEWDEVASTVISQIGKPTPGAANVVDDVNFSVSTFITNFEKLTPDAKKILFSGGGQRAELAGELDKLVNTVGRLKETERLANTSGTARHLITFLLGGVAMLEPTSAAGGVAVASGAAKLMTSPKFIRWLNGVPKSGGAPALLKHANKLRVLAREQAGLAPVVNQYLDQIQQQLGEAGANQRPPPARGQEVRQAPTAPNQGLLGLGPTTGRR